jgi:hypothetical protein
VQPVQATGLPPLAPADAVTAPPDRMPVDALYEAGMRLTLQVLTAPQ